MEHVVCKHEKQNGPFCGKCGAALEVALTPEEQGRFDRAVTRVVSEKFGLTPKSSEEPKPKPEQKPEPETLHDRIFGRKRTNSGDVAG